MMGLSFAQRPGSVLAVGAHPDDIEIGCGGTLLQLARRWPGLPVTLVILTGTPVRQEEARTAAELFLPDCDVTLRHFTLPDGRLPSVWGEAKELLERTATEVNPDLVLTHRPDDAHQDHRVAAELVPTVWRDHLVLTFEIPKYDGDLGRPNLYVPMDENTAREKVRLLSKAFPSQAGRDWWDEELFLGLARVRGMESRSRYAEAFTVSKAIARW